MTKNENRIQDIVKKCIGCSRPVCVMYCPSKLPISKILKCMQENKEEEAAKILYEHTKFPFVCGSLCDVDEKCFGHCIKNKMNDAVAFHEIEAYLGEKYVDLLWNTLPEPKPYRVAIIGGGICALTIALSLIQVGIYPIVYEKTNQLGGVLTHSLPSFRYDKKIFYDVLNKLNNGILKINYQRIWGKNLFKEELETYDTVVFAYGSELSRSVLATDDVYQALDLLKNAALTTTIQNQDVLVIGGGNVAMDIARTMIRQNNRVFVVYRRNILNAPASKKEIQHALAEGIQFLEYLSPIEVIKEGSQVVGLRCDKMELFDDGSTRLNFRKTGVEVKIQGNVIIEALGSKTDDAYLKECYPRLFDEKNKIIIDESYHTPYPNLYIGGDALTGPADFSSAVHSGIQIAENIKHGFQKRSNNE